MHARVQRTVQLHVVQCVMEISRELIETRQSLSIYTIIPGSVCPTDGLFSKFGRLCSLNETSSLGGHSKPKKTKAHYNI